MTQQLAHASIIGDFGKGYDDRQAARPDIESGKSRDSLCPSDSGISYYPVYKIGYLKMWGDMNDIQLKLDRQTKVNNGGLVYNSCRVSGAFEFSVAGVVCGTYKSIPKIL